MPIAVTNNEFKAMPLADIKALFRESNKDEKAFLDVKGIYKVSELNEAGMRW